MLIFAFDFSIAKPAMCFHNTNDGTVKFFCWPMGLDNKTIDMLSESGVNVMNRDLVAMSKKNFSDGVAMVMEHTKRAALLSEMIKDTIFECIEDNGTDDVVVVSEGLSFGSKGNQTLDLSGYKYTMLTTLYKAGIRKFVTYSPVAIKHTALMGKDKSFSYNKDFMISSIKETKQGIHPFIDTLITNDEKLRKKSALVKCVDDIVDSYWAARTYCEKENLERHYLV